MPRLIALFSLSLAAAGLPAAVASAASAAAAIKIYASPTGSGTSCTAAAPCSLSEARQQVRAKNQNMDADIEVLLYGGTYRLSSPLQLGVEDSGTNGHTVVWQAAPGQKPVFSGGRPVTGWQVHDPAKGIYRAAVPAGTASRQLFVNGVRADRTRGPIKPSGFSHTSTGFTSSDPKYRTWRNPTSIEIVGRIAWKEPRCPVASITASGAGSAFTLAQPCFANGGASPIQTSLYPYHGGDGVNFNAVAFVENAYELLDKPGQFYLDSAEGQVYYIPRPGENLAVAEVELPVTQALVTMDGTPGHLVPVNDTDASIAYSAAGAWSADTGRTGGDFLNDVHSTTANGDHATITFNGTGLDVLGEKASDQGDIEVFVDGVPAGTVSATGSGDMLAQQVLFSKTGLPQGTHRVKLVKKSGAVMRIDGYVPVTAPIASVHDIALRGITFSYTTWLQPSGNNGYRDRQGGNFWVGPPAYFGRIPAAVTVSRGKNIEVSGNEFTRLGGSGLDFANGTQNSQITGNRVNDVSGIGVNVGEINDHWLADPARMTSGDVIKNNYIAYVGQDYSDSNGLMLGYIRDVTVDNNEIAHTSYTGISIGWGAGWSSSCALQQQTRPDPCRRGTSYMRNNAITDNYVHDVMKVLNDGGLIYTWGGQGDASVRSTMSGNLLSTNSAAQGAGQGLYLDEGSSWWDVHHNVVSQTAETWNHQWVPTIHDITVHHNYSDITRVRNDGTNVTITDNTFVTDGNWPQAARDIAAAAGLERAYRHLAPPEPYLQSDGAIGNLLAPAKITYSGSWKEAVKTDSDDLNKDLRYTTVNGDSVKFTFTGIGIEILGQRGSNQAVMSATLDGLPAGTVTTLAPDPKVSQQAIYQVSGLPYGSHTVVLTKTGGANATIDGYRLTRSLNDDDLSLTYGGSWSTSTGRNPGDHQGDVHSTTANGDSVAATFSGTGITFLGDKEPGGGKIDVYVDGKLRQTVTANGTSAAAQDIIYSISGLRRGIHSVRLEKKDGRQLLIDRVDIAAATPVAGPLVGAAGNRCTDIPNANKADGTELILWDCNGGTNQSWILTGGTVRAMGKCMEVKGGSSADLAPVQLNTCNGSQAQQWTHDPRTGQLQANGKCLDAYYPGTVNGTKLILYTCNGNTNQQWRVASTSGVPVQGEAFTAANGVQPYTKTAADNGRTLGSIDPGDWARYNGIAVNGATGVRARVVSGGPGGTIQVRTGSQTGPILGSITVPNTGNWTTFKEVSTTLSNVPAGTTDVFLTFTGTGTGLFDVDSFTFTWN